MLREPTSKVEHLLITTVLPAQLKPKNVHPYESTIYGYESTTDGDTVATRRDEERDFAHAHTRAVLHR